jgi:hypothetical protein
MPTIEDFNAYFSREIINATAKKDYERVDEIILAQKVFLQFLDEFNNNLK